MDGWGLTHVYTGEGKGKTTAALGLALRAMGWGARVLMVQFIKGYSEIGEIKFAEGTEGQFTVKQFALDTQMCIDEEKVNERKASSEEAISFAEEAVNSGSYDLVILDEINNAIHYNLIDMRRVLALMFKKPDNVELVLTGRRARPEIVKYANYASDIRQVRHPFDQGVTARAGIDY